MEKRTYKQTKAKGTGVTGIQGALANVPVLGALFGTGALNLSTDWEVILLAVAGAIAAGAHSLSRSSWLSRTPKAVKEADRAASIAEAVAAVVEERMAQREPDKTPAEYVMEDDV